MNDSSETKTTKLVRERIFKVRLSEYEGFNLLFLMYKTKLVFPELTDQ